MKVKRPAPFAGKRPQTRGRFGLAFALLRRLKDMNSTEAIDMCADTADPARSLKEAIVRMPLGLLGLEQYKQFTVQAKPEEEPFLRLRVNDEPKLSFLVVSPFLILPTYAPDISDQDQAFLGLKDPQDCSILTIATVRGSEQATVNLKGPIVLNRRTLVAKQVIPNNATEYSVAYPLPVQTS
jgi:flagellar assembly factor FliW